MEIKEVKNGSDITTNDPELEKNLEYLRDIKTISEWYDLSCTEEIGYDCRCITVNISYKVIDSNTTRKNNYPYIRTHSFSLHYGGTGKDIIDKKQTLIDSWIIFAKNENIFDGNITYIERNLLIEEKRNRNKLMAALNSIVELTDMYSDKNNLFYSSLSLKKMANGLGIELSDSIDAVNALFNVIGDVIVELGEDIKVPISLGRSQYSSYKKVFDNDMTHFVPFLLSKESYEYMKELNKKLDIDISSEVSKFIKTLYDSKKDNDIKIIEWFYSSLKNGHEKFMKDIESLDKKQIIDQCYYIQAEANFYSELMENTDTKDMLNVAKCIYGKVDDPYAKILKYLKEDSYDTENINVNMLYDIFTDVFFEKDPETKLYNCKHLIKSKMTMYPTPGSKESKVILRCSVCGNKFNLDGTPYIEKPIYAEPQQFVYPQAIPFTGLQNVPDLKVDFDRDKKEKIENKESSVEKICEFLENTIKELRAQDKKEEEK